MIDIPNYEIGKLAGRGGIAEVYLARHKLLDRKVAIKLISPAHADDLADKRFLKEARVVAGLRHPNIVSIYDVGVYENKYYIIMEYLEGGDLKQNIKRTLPVSQTLAIMRQIASALAHAHDKGFIHRDIKSQNIMFRGDGTAVLTDFGIVKDLAADTGYTMDGTSIGTPHYMSPEQAQGAGGIDWRTDLYSLGVTFYEMLTGSVPYVADSPIAVALKHIKDPVPQLPEPFSRFQPIISRLMAKNPDDRYQSAHDLIRAINRLDGEDATPAYSLRDEDATPTYPFLRPQKFGRKVNLVNIFSGVVIGCIICGLSLFIYLHLAGRTEGQKALAGKSQPSAGSPVDPSAQAKKQTFIDAIKNKLAPDGDTEQLHLKKLDYLIQARERFNQDRFTSPEQDNALFYYRKILEMDPGDPEARQGIADIADKCKNLAESARKDKNYAEALQWIKDARLAAPLDTELQLNEWLVRGDMYAFRGEFKTPENENALQYYRKVLEQSPRNKQALIKIAAIDVQIPLYQVRQKGPLSEKISAYETLFSSLNSAIAEHGEQDMADLKREVMDQVREDMETQKNRKKTVPAEFLALVSGQFPDEKDLFNSQYDILIAQGDESASKQEKADFYLKALKLSPASANAKLKIEKVAKSLDDSGKPDEAQAVLKKAMDIAPEHGAFNDMLQDIKQLQSTKAEISALLSKIQQTNDIAEKTKPYSALFSRLNPAVKRYGSKGLTNLIRDVKAQVQADIQGGKNSGQLIPDEFLSLLKKYFPEMHKSAVNAQYDILIGKGDKGASNQEAADYYLKALIFDKNRVTAKNKIELLIKDMEANGDSQAAADLLSKAVQIVPNELIFAQLSGTMESKVEVFATSSGCSKENRITRTLASIESVSICIIYKNMSPDSVVNIVLQQKGGKTMEAPLILDGRSGRKPIDIMAPIEGFSPGEYSISVRQGGKILSETMIQFTPQRR
ncbi:MAG: serine/threonine protein kinase [Desulfobacteraceae bacterium]|nr:MAG: serine/threonine protein kinase [Desulfobacteraceae bacterium]